MRTNLIRALHVARLKKPLNFAGYKALREIQPVQSQVSSSACYYHVTSRLSGRATSASDSKYHFPRIHDNQDPVELFNKHLQDGTLTKPMAHACLKTAARRELWDKGLGEATIKWMWNDHDSYQFPRDTSLLEHMVRHLVRESKEELVWKWIEQKSRKSARLGPNDRFVWRADAVKALIATQAFVSDHDSLDGAVETFLRAKSSSYSIPLAPARMECAKLLMLPVEKTTLDWDVNSKLETPRWPNTSTKLWQEFLDAVETVRDVSEPLKAQLPLYHPEKPDPMPYLKHSQHLAKNPKIVEKMVKKPSITPWIARGRHAEALLRLQGQEKDADWLKQFLQELYTQSEPSRRKEAERKISRRERNGSTGEQG
ncbi:uncharacterized protein M437DRAFT_58382 [Aureobasidium melanogenum CBS 110374]|uniref:Uncharacterized protein n=1 Tax=Aureobasidium melanogenum (strain CBS 110374) TaxID=1043003 RepID=A0A074VEI9_AURM1|nr:uncharacterized protein M437DRAFT_58382 [Aureobasidium melanogenum CBS 110374]KEQ58838.1 hypothetical protein M437DRAFT_58382 [Aureobasidium melanogenum CBS 110374]